MEKLSGLLGIIGVCLAVKMFEYFGFSEIQAFLLLEAYIIFTLFSICKLSKELFIKAICLYGGIFWSLVFILDCFLIDISLIITMLGALPLYILSAKKVINNKREIKLSFNECLIVHFKPFKWYHWLWLLVGKDLDAYRAFYEPKKDLYIKVINGKLVERKVSHELFAREIRALNADITVAKVTYEELQGKLGTKINCKKEIY